MAGVQKPHCSPWFSQNDSRSGWSLSPPASPSTVVTAQPSACTANIRQERAEAPSTRTVQLPHTPCSQARCVPVKSRSSRRKSASVSRASTSAVTDAPFTDSPIVRVFATISGSLHGPLERQRHRAAHQHRGDLRAILAIGVDVGRRVEAGGVLAAGIAEGGLVQPFPL